MTLLIIDEDMYNFESAEDAFTWIHLHRTDEEILILGDSEEDEEELQAYLEVLAPIQIM